MESSGHPGPSPYNCVWYVFSRLEGQAANQILPWLDHYAHDPDVVDEDAVEFLFDQLDLAFRDQHVEERALRGLSLLEQGNRPFQAVLRDF